MRLMIVLPTLAGGGAERVFVNISAHFAGLGWAVTVVTIGGAEFDAYRLDPRVERIELGLMIDSRNPVQAVVAVLRRISAIRRAIRLRKPDVVVGVMPSSAVMSILAASGTRASVIVAERSYPPAVPISRHWNWLRRRLYRFASVVAVQTESTAVWVKQTCRPRRVAVIPNACEWPLEDYEPFVPVPGGGRYVLAVGRLGPEKGFDLLIEAWASIAHCFPECRLVIAGEGGERDRLRALVERHDLVQRVQLPGRIGNVSDWFAGAELFVLSSRFEGFPNVLVEAMAAGCAVVAFDCLAGPRDIVRDGIDGRLVPAGDVEALATAMAELLDNPGIRARYSATARCITDRLSAGQVYAQWQKLFLDIRKN